jgi:hypothetical protein
MTTPLLVGRSLVRWSVASRYSQSRPRNTGSGSRWGTSKKSGLRNHWTGRNWARWAGGRPARSGVRRPDRREAEEALPGSLGRDSECLRLPGGGWKEGRPEEREARLSEGPAPRPGPSVSRVEPLRVLMGCSHREPDTREGARLVREEEDWKPLSRPAELGSRELRSITEPEGRRRGIWTEDGRKLDTEEQPSSGGD